MSELSEGLEKTTKDLSDSWRHLRAIAKHETATNTVSMEAKMK